MQNIFPSWLQKLHWYQKLAVVAFLAVCMSWVLQLLTPKPTAIDQFSRNYNQTTTKFSRVTFTGVAPTIPEKLALAEFQNGGASLDELAKPLLERYQLLQLNSKIPVWVGPEYSMSKNVSGNSISLSRNQASGEQTRITDAYAIALAQDTIASLYPTISVLVIPEQTKRFLAGTDLTEVQGDVSEIIRLILMPTIQNIPLYDFFRSHSAIEVWVSSAGLEKLVVAPPLLSATPGEMQPSISINQALEQIEAGVGSIIVANPQDFTTSPKLNEVDHGTFSAVFLEYRSNPETKMVIPSFRFEGTITTLTGEQLDAEVITPAIMGI